MSVYYLKSVNFKKNELNDNHFNNLLINYLIFICNHYIPEVILYNLFDNIFIMVFSNKNVFGLISSLSLIFKNYYDKFISTFFLIYNIYNIFKYGLFNLPRNLYLL